MLHHGQGSKLQTAGKLVNWPRCGYRSYPRIAASRRNFDSLELIKYIAVYTRQPMLICWMARSLVKTSLCVSDGIVTDSATIPLKCRLKCRCSSWSALDFAAQNNVHEHKNSKCCRILRPIIRIGCSALPLLVDPLYPMQFLDALKE